MSGDAGTNRDRLIEFVNAQGIELEFNERIAPAIGMIVSKVVGLETGTASADYIKLYHGNASLLTGSLEVIQKTSAVILTALETKPETERQESRDGLAAAS